jgi:DNA-binding YbaB/EbfC family protein
MNNMQQMIKQAKKMQEQLARLQEELAEKTVESLSGGGMVRAVVSGRQELVAITIEPEALEQGDKEMLEDLIVAAINEGLRRSKEMMEEQLSKLTGGFKPPFL